MNRNSLCAFFLLATLISPTSVFADVMINFDDLMLNNNEQIPQTYGDNFLFDVSYREIDSFGNGIEVAESLSFWNIGFGELQNVVWGSDLDPSRVAEIRFNSLSANPILLNRLDAAGWNSSASNQTFRVYDNSYNLLFETSGIDFNEVARATITPNVSSNTLILQWDYPWGVAVDNISITAIPEPNSLVLLGACSACCIFRRRRIATQ